MEAVEHQVGAYEAKTHFAELLERVAGGQAVTITRHGAPVARLIPVRARPTSRQRREAILALRELAQGTKLKGLRIRDLMAEGRR